MTVCPHCQNHLPDLPQGAPGSANLAPEAMAHMLGIAASKAEHFLKTFHVSAQRPSWTCVARKQGTPGGNAPADCDWPGCGCDPAANKVLEAIDEAGFEITKKPEPTPWDANHNRGYEPVETLAKEIYDGFVYDGPGTKPKWTPGGNGLKQDEARFEARRRLREAGHASTLSRPHHSSQGE